MYIIRLDDASEKMDLKKWSRMEELLDNYNIIPIVGVIPKCEDYDFEKYEYNINFWNMVKVWKDKNWLIAMHGYRHVFDKDCYGINPINKYSEFAGCDLKVQKQKIKKGYEIFLKKGIEPEIFFAPAHTFDNNTLVALKSETNIRIVSDTIANDVYYENEIYFIPQQCGNVRKLPFKTTTFCYHPNNMDDKDFKKLEKFINKHRYKFGLPKLKKRKFSIFDFFLKKIYFFIRKLKK